MSRPRLSEPMLTAWVVVLGDFGRSPRMQYHTLSLSKKANTCVHVIAYPGAKPLAALQTAPNVHFATVSEPPAWLRQLPRILALLLKVVMQLLQLLWLMLLRLPKPDCILLQNPPAIPTLLICWLAARRHKARLIIDWHNYGYTILGLTQGPQHWLVKLARSHERVWGKRGDKHFCVTHAMKNDLQANWGIPDAITLHDRPPAFFQRTDLATTHQLFQRIQPSLLQPTWPDYLQHVSIQQPGSLDSTLLTETRSTGAVTAAAGRPAVVVSSTSWTPDEDMGLLFEAAVLYDQAAQQPQHSNLPPLLILITGKGPQKAMYEARLPTLELKRVAIRTLWLEASDYPLLLGAVDVGVCLHSSSSGLDLPMKVVDMFGSGLPVCALSYSCIDELVSDGETGLLFKTPEELSEHLQQLLAGFPVQPNQLLQRLQQGVRDKQQSVRWDDNWDRVAWPVLRN